MSTDAIQYVPRPRSAWDGELGDVVYPRNQQYEDDDGDRSGDRDDNEALAGLVREEVDADAPEVGNEAAADVVAADVVVTHLIVLFPKPFCILQKCVGRRLRYRKAPRILSVEEESVPAIMTSLGWDVGVVRRAVP
ncbi:hypothetical protein PsYK624_053630 [Phanerochaete sordida]|uniref:Uncharacterized protein n=1 Tax=Phanerochaete sordida TaxID=48140 RepID=A0A9P3G6S2_9APHY|nr:hypothetical protein PsYK624_053630 [Phanerochaete sordida]